jgi:hypothetical protein
MFTNCGDEYTPPGYRQQSLPVTIPISAEQRQRQNRRTTTASFSSSTAANDSDDQSNASFPSSVTSSVPSLNPPQPVAPMNPINYGYEFRCEFEFVGCQLSFHPTQIDSYISHTTSHFVDHRPPPRTCCIFCDRRFENSHDPVASWRKRILHIADHQRHLARPEDMRPDFFVIEHMRKKGIITVEDYKWATRHTERPLCDGLVDRSYRTPEMKRKEERLTEERYDQEKEDRHRRRHISSKRKDKGKGR